MKPTPQLTQWAALITAALIPALATSAQTAPATQPTGSAPAAAAPTDEKPPMQAEEIEALVAPIALYSDSVLSQVLMASTYPVEVVQAQRWLDSKGGNVKDDAVAKDLEAQPWDASVKSLCNVPQTLKMMSDKLDWTSKLGDAVLQDQKAVMDAVQRLRAKANATGNLKSNEQQKVSTENTGGTTTYIIQQSDPEVIYVPTYNPTVVYGGWSYPSYPPAYYYPPGYVASNVVSFGVGVACGLAWGYAWGNCNWGGNDIDIDCNRNVNRNTNINRDKARQNAGRSGAAGSNGRGNWKHDSAHRGGASYRNQATANKVGAGNRGGAGVSNTAGSRDALRGRTDPGAGNRAGGAGAGTRDVGAGNRGAGGAGAGSGAGASNRGAFGGSNGSGASARNNSSRGNSSLGGGSRSGGASRSSGGASRGGGSRGGGGRGGGGRR
ncbi:MAG: DUF3300 domain-containing protein [Phycisphaerales bacterium]